ncbi:filamentous hemagglutinin N-terminal domain-containing protein [Campylobacter lari]|nr:filamentous hemagglutinin N-terminal domain-containing protein [Campylobacter lari]
MKKLANHIILSGVTVSMLFSPLMALPSGGKFTHGTSGSITSNGNNMQVSGNGKNSVIQWGGGFSIGKGQSVNFGNNNFKGQQNYLNIAHGTSKSMIEGILNAGGNNVFLINPNGVIITKTGTINANRFVASTSSMDSKSMQDFADGKLAYNTFSPVFKPNGGNVVNMGTIDAKNVTLQGNKVMLSADTSWDDKNNKIKYNQITADNIDLKGNEVYVDISTIKSKNLTTEAKNKGIAYLSATGYYYNPTREYNDIVFTTKGVMDKTYNQYISIGSDLDWWHFAKGWNEKADFRNNVAGNTFKLTNNIDFKASSGQNYANYWIDLNGDGKKDANEFTNMIVGFKDDSAFTKTFDGQGYTLKNININTVSDEVKNKPRYVGLFGKADGANFKNIIIDYKNGGINAKGINDYIRVGGFAGTVRASNISNIYISNINNISSFCEYTEKKGFVGGFIGEIDKSDISNIYISDIKKISGGIAGGFAGIFATEEGQEKVAHDIYINNIDDILGVYTGGFIGKSWYVGFNNVFISDIDRITGELSASGFIAEFNGAISFDSPYVKVELKNISINNIKEIRGLDTESRASGFIGSVHFNTIFKNIILNNIGRISAGEFASGFIGDILPHRILEFQNIYIFFDKGAEIIAKHPGKFYSGYLAFGDPHLDNVHIYHHKDNLANATFDQKYWGDTYNKIQFHIYDDSDKDEVYNKFKEQADAIYKPIFPVVPPSKPPKPSIPSTEDIINETATLDQGDLISNDIWDYIINDIDKVHYNIDIRLLAKLLSEYSNISNKTEDEQVEFVTTYLGVKENDARALLQSLSFLNAYKDHDINKANFKNETVKANFANSFKNADTEFTNFNNKKNELYNELKILNKNIVSKGFDIEYLLDENQEKLAKFIKAYNDYIVLIEKGLKNENDPAFINIKNTIIKLNNEAKNLYAQLLDYKDQLQDFKDNNEFKKVIIAGDFKTIPLLITPDVNKPINGGGEDGDYEKISRQIADSQKQTPTFEYEDEETEEVEESAFKQKGKICIVSDNFKTMNPCIVGGL